MRCFSDWMGARRRGWNLSELGLTTSHLRVQAFENILRDFVLYLLTTLSTRSESQLHGLICESRDGGRKTKGESRQAAKWGSRVSESEKWPTYNHPYLNAPSSLPCLDHHSVQHHTTWSYTHLRLGFDVWWRNVSGGPSQPLNCCRDAQPRGDRSRNLIPQLCWAYPLWFLSSLFRTTLYYI